MCLLLAGCGTDDGDPAGESTITTEEAQQQVLAPQLPAHDEVNAIAVMHTLESVTVAEGELCAVTENGELLVFSEDVTGDENGIVAGEVEIPVGGDFTSGDIAKIDGGQTCGGTHYDKAIHVVTPGLTPGH